MSQVSSQSTLYKRKWSVIVSGNGQALDLSQMHLIFSVNQSDVETPNNAVVRLYNLSDDTASTLLTKEYTRVTISAGYVEGPFGTIFDGQIKQTRKGRENQTDKYLDILAADGDEAYNFAVINQTLAAGSTIKDQITALAGTMGASGVTLGELPEWANAGNPQLIRGKVLYGLSKDYMRNIAQTNGARWSIQNGKLFLIKNTEYVQVEPIVLTSKTGMIGLPEQTQDGINIKCLLNPKLAIGQPVRIDNASVQRQQFDVAYGAINLFPTISTDGLYRVIVSEFEGDTRGDDWYSKLTCLSIDPSSPAGTSVNPWPGN